MATSGLGIPESTAKLYLFQSVGTDLYALSLRAEERIPRVNGCPQWRLRAEIPDSSLLSGADPTELMRVLAEVRQRGFILFRAQEVPLH
jgi:hypothetical protein